MKFVLPFTAMQLFVKQKMSQVSFIFSMLINIFKFVHICVFTSSTFSEIEDFGSGHVDTSMM